ncbi:DUF1593 domain-containing protein [Arenibacter echinorum]|uniref:Uncharacterized protein DUF1593 n=1 Tax=Arenibacter echinorum TaxID=440515 RepID=A0A327R2S0_9FLAO|nr:DUF1593 domain-containing protein [Arenibacter echinorum]RAJ10262.1 uncharacterized protein DUF1593 [Arenibacter echinorum]
MKRFYPLFVFFFFIINHSQSQSVKPRLIVLADMGNETDEVQQMHHLLMCSNAIDIEGLIAVTGIFLQPSNPTAYRSVTHPELFQKLIDGYEKVYPNLNLHAKGWPPPFGLRIKVSSGQPEYGMSGVGDGKSTEGSNWIINRVTQDDSRPIHVVINAGSNTLAQALYDYRKTHTTKEVDAFVEKLRVYENAAQDEAGAWINNQFPKIHWIRSIHQTKNFGGPDNKNLGPHNWKPFPYTSKGQDDWAHEHVRSAHGALGELYPMRQHTETDQAFDNPPFIEGGGTIPWMSLVPHGLTDPSEQTWGGWSGRFGAKKVKNVPSRIGRVKPHEEVYKPWEVYTDAIDHWVDPETGIEYHDENTAIWPWRQAMWNDLHARMDWCIKTYKEANHHPVAVINGDSSDQIVRVSAKVEDKLDFDALASTDPDRDSLDYKWWIYPEAGMKPYGTELSIENADQAKISITVPNDAKGKELHLILEVWDESEIVPLVDYRRVVISVE